MSKHTKPTRNTLLLVFLAALIVRAGFCFVTISVLKMNIGPNRPDFFTSTDGYIDLAVNVVDHGVYAFSPDGTPTAYRAPLYPAVLAVAYAALGNAAWAILLVNCVASAAACVVVFIIAQRLLGERVSGWWAIPIVLFPLSIYYCASSFSDTFLTLTIALYMWALIALMHSPKTKTGIGAAVAFAATALTKAVVLPIPLLVCAYAGLRHRNALKHSFLALLVGFSLVGVWTYRNYRTTGAFVPVTGGAGFNLLLGNFMIDRGGNCDSSLKYARMAAVEHLRNVEGITIDLDRLDTAGHLDVPRAIDAEYGRAAVAMYRNDPMLVVRKLAINSARFWYFSSSPTKSLANGIVNLTILMLALIGWWQLRLADRATAELLALFVVAFMLLYAGVIVHSSRFSLPIVMGLLPLATSPIASAWHVIAGKRAEPNLVHRATVSKTALTGAKS